MHGDGLADDEAIGDELADGLAGVGVGDFADFVGVEPDLALAAVRDRGRQALLGTEVHPASRVVLVVCFCSGSMMRGESGIERSSMVSCVVGTMHRNRVRYTVQSNLHLECRCRWMSVGVGASNDVAGSVTRGRG